MTVLSPDQKREAVGERILQLFSGDKTELGSLKKLAESTSEMLGIESFLTPLSWSMRLADGRIISGNAEYLLSAVKDIVNQANLLMQNYSQNTAVSLLIEEVPAPLISKTGSSGNFVGNSSRHQFQLAAIEQYPLAVTCEVP